VKVDTADRGRRRVRWAVGVDGSAAIAIHGTGLVWERCNGRLAASGLVRPGSRAGGVKPDGLAKLRHTGVERDRLLPRFVRVNPVNSSWQNIDQAKTRFFLRVFLDPPGGRWL
jgi:hypothetical protein